MPRPRIRPWSSVSQPRSVTLKVILANTCSCHCVACCCSLCLIGVTRLILTTTSGEQNYHHPVLEMRQLRHRKVRWVAEGLTWLAETEFPGWCLSSFPNITSCRGGCGIDGLLFWGCCGSQGPLVFTCSPSLSGFCLGTPAVDWQHSFTAYVHSLRRAAGETGTPNCEAACMKSQS